MNYHSALITQAFAFEVFFKQQHMVYTVGVRRPNKHLKMQ